MASSFGGSLELSYRFFLWSDREPSLVRIEPHVVMWTLFLKPETTAFTSEIQDRVSKLPAIFSERILNSSGNLNDQAKFKLKHKNQTDISLLYNPHNHTSTSHTGIIQTCSYSKLLESRSAFILFPSYLRDHSWPLYQAEFVLLNFEIQLSRILKCHLELHASPSYRIHAPKALKL